MGKMSGGGSRKESLAIDSLGCRLSFLVLEMCPNRGVKSLKRVWVLKWGWGTVRFWFDDWMGVGPLSILFPRVFRIPSNKESSIRDHCVWHGDEVSWEVSLRRALR